MGISARPNSSTGGPSHCGRGSCRVLLELGRQTDAFGVLERSRARALLAMLAERDLVFSADVPEDLERERKRTGAEYDRIQAKLGEIAPSQEAPEVERLLGRLRELRRDQAEVAEKIRRASPRFASLQYPEPLGLAGMRDALDPGTVLLSYSTGKDGSLLFVVRRTAEEKASGDLSVFAIASGEDVLRAQVRDFRAKIQEGSGDGPGLPAREARRLFDELIGPAEGLIASSERVLICPDGPLHVLPFAALMRGKRYFVEWKPIHVVVSGTVYSQVKQARRGDRAPAAARVVAFGDPVYPKVSRENAEEIANPEVRLEVMRGRAFDRLSATRREVAGIAAVFGDRASTHLGAEATEERAKATGREARYVHFACHGLVNERFPLNSALALTIPEKPAAGQDNGLLQAWEVFEQVRLDADLVTLSACGSGLGAEMRGEGLVGLTRAFQYAGARSVLASLWGVGDESTAELMARFYGYLRQGSAKDEALRLAQIDFIRQEGALSHPFRWAAFQLAGDWK